MQVPAGAMAVQQAGGGGVGSMGGAGLVEPESQLSPSNPGLVAATQRGSPCPPHSGDVALGQELDGVYRYTIHNKHLRPKLFGQELDGVCRLRLLLLMLCVCVCVCECVCVYCGEWHAAASVSL